MTPAPTRRMSLQREYFVDRRIRIVFWLTQNEIVKLAHAAPEFWAHRHRVVEFVEAPKAEQVLRQTHGFDLAGRR